MMLRFSEESSTGSARTELWLPKGIFLQATDMSFPLNDTAEVNQVAILAWPVVKDC